MGKQRNQLLLAGLFFVSRVKTCVWLRGWWAPGRGQGRSKLKNEGEDEEHGRVIRGETNWLISVRSSVIH